MWPSNMINANNMFMICIPISSSATQMHLSIVMKHYDIRKQTRWELTRQQLKFFSSKIDLLCGNHSSNNAGAYILYSKPLTKHGYQHFFLLELLAKVIVLFSCQRFEALSSLVSSLPSSKWHEFSFTYSSKRLMWRGSLSYMMRVWVDCIALFIF